MPSSLLRDVDQVVDVLRTNYGIDMPGADLLLTNSYDELMPWVIEPSKSGSVSSTGGMRPSDVPQCRHRLAIMGQDGGPPASLQIYHFEQDRGGLARLHRQFRNWSAGQAAAATAFNFAPPRAPRRLSSISWSGSGIAPASTLSTGGRWTEHSQEIRDADPCAAAFAGSYLRMGKSAR